jgi:hypothetical protein
VDSEELIGKMDALLNKHRQSAPVQRGGVPEIPVLVNVVELPLAAAAKPILPPETAKQAVSVEPPAATAATALSDSDAEFLARSIFRHVMNNLEARLAHELGDQLTERLESIIDDTVSTAIADFRQELTNAVSDAIAEALLDYAESHSNTPAQGEKPDSL